MQFVFRGHAKRWKTVIRAHFPGSTEEFWRYDTNIAAARAALARLGQPVTLQYPAGAGPAESVAILIQSSLRQAGVDFRLEALTPSVYNQRRQSGTLTFFTDELDAPVVPDAHYELNQLYTSKALQPALLKFQDAAKIDPISAQLNVLDPQRDTRRYVALLRQAQSILVPLMPIIPIAMTGATAAMHRNIDTTKAFSHQHGFLRWNEISYKA
jgi:ABC-type transport system substrate-binding protein